ncbi:MAG: membrane protein insertase YidC, partial [Malacoplasma sp.]|nr:membrane protein insertase YidC [Malacoplasma sp.]
FNTQTTDTTTTSSPFWVKPKDNKAKVKKVFKEIWKWTKILILLFFFVMGLWGCFQSSFDTNVATSTNMGCGLEFGFKFGTTGDPLYDLQASGTAQYHTFEQWTMAYGPFYAWFVWPGAWITQQICWGTHTWWGGLNALLAIFVLILIIRLLTGAITIRSTLQNEKMQEVNGQLAEINAKYKGLKDMRSRQMKQQEIMQLYKKNDIRPFAAFEQIFITLPIFLIIYRVVTILRPLKNVSLFTIWNFSYTPLTQVFNSFTDGGWTYIFFLLIVIPTQFLSTWLPTYWAKKRNRSATTSTAAGAKQNKRRGIFQYVFTGVMALLVAFTPCGVGVYWFLNSLFAILQSWIMHKIIIRQRKKKFKQGIGQVEIV